MREIVLAVLLVTVSAGKTLAQDVSLLHNLNQLLNRHHYHQALQKTSTLLNLNRQTLRQKHLTRYDLLNIKAHALLQLKLFSQAADAFRATAKSSSNISNARVARANADLISRSIRGEYVSQPHGKGGMHPARIGIFSTASRAEAMRVFSQDQWKTLQPRIAAAIQASGINPIIRLFADLRTAVDIQTAARLVSTGVGANTTPEAPAVSAMDTISQFMVSRVNKGCQSMLANTNIIHKSANNKIAHMTNGHRTMVRRGVTPAQVDQLQTTIQTCQDIQALVRRFIHTFPDFPEDCSLLNKLNATSRHIQNSAQINLPSR